MSVSIVGCVGQTNETVAVADAEIDAAILDTDEDGVLDPDDLCPQVPDAEQTDTDEDGRGDACDLDDDGDGVADAIDSCILVPNAGDRDTDGDGLGDQCDDDDDGDGVADSEDLCPLASNDQGRDTDGDGLGDVCDDDVDGDGVVDTDDNCPLVANGDQADSDRDREGDACDGDLDGDEVPDEDDNCPSVANSDQSDRDGDLTGDLCDPCSDDADDDADEDSVCADLDNCPTDTNPQQEDSDEDGIGDVCDVCPLDGANDADGDGACSDVDNCPERPNAAQSDGDGDGLGDPCDGCPNDPLNDQDGDGHCGNRDRCPEVEDPLQLDSDLDGAGDACDPCPLDDENDADEDTVCGDVDNCIDVANEDQSDIDGDGFGDACDFCQGGGPEDPDEDSICFNEDNCPNLANPDQTNRDGDDFGDRCDPCPLDADNDVDGDRVCGDVDLCDEVPDPEQLDFDNDGIGDACDDDIDGDRALNEVDNCPSVANPDQAETYGDERGDACELRYLDEPFEAPLEGWEMAGGWARHPSAASNGEWGLASPINLLAQTFEAERMRATSGAGFGDFWMFESNGQVRTDDVVVPATGTYELTASAYGAVVGGEAPRMELQVDGRPRAEFVVDAPVATPGSYSQRIRLTAGRHAVSYALINEGGDDQGAVRQLYLDAFTVTGPVDNDRELLAGGATQALSPVLDFRDAERPRLSFSTRFFLPDTVLVYEALARGEVLASAEVGRGAIEDAFRRFELDLTALAGEPRVQIRFSLVMPPGHQGGVDIDDVVVDERNPLPALGLPYRTGFESFDGWLVSGAEWTIADRAYSGDGAIEVSIDEPGWKGDSFLDLAQPIDLTGTVDPVLSFLISGGPYQGGRSLVAELIPSGRRNHFVRVLPIRNDGVDSLYQRVEISLADFAGDPNLGLRLRFHNEPFASPFSFRIDELSMFERETPAALELPVDSGLPFEGISYDSAGWAVVDNAEGETVLRSGAGVYTDDTIGLVSLGHFDFTQAAAPRLALWSRYAVRAGEQAVWVIARTDEGESRYPLVDPRADAAPMAVAVVNPSAEGLLDGWTIEEGHLEALLAGECGGGSPYDGSRYFAIGGLCDTSETAHATQVVSLAPWAQAIADSDAIIRFRARGRTAVGRDTVGLTLTFRDPEGNAIGDRLETSSQSATWSDMVIEAQIPDTAAEVEIGMTGSRAEPGPNHAFVDALRLDVSLPWAMASAAFYERLDVNLSAHAGQVTELFLESQTDEQSGPGIEINRLQVWDWATRTGVARRALHDFEGADAPTATAGPWEVVPNEGRNGSTGLAPADGNPIPGRVQRRRIEYMPSVDLSALKRPRLSFWVRYLDAQPGHALNVRVHANDRAETRDGDDRIYHGRVFPVVVANHEVSAAQTDGFQRIELPLDGFAGSRSTAIIFETVDAGPERARLVIDDVALDERPDNPDAVISMDGADDYTVFLNGEEVGSGAFHGAAERFYAAVRPGRNVLAVEANSPEEAASIIGSIRYGNLTISTGDAGWVSSNEEQDGWESVVFDDAEWAEVEVGDGPASVFGGTWLLLDTERGARPITHVDGGARQFFRINFTIDDWDQDGLPDGIDLCPNLASPDQSDWNGNGIGDVCDPCPTCFNVALGARARAQSTQPGNDYVPGRVSDGELTCGSWVAQGNAAWLEVDLGSRHRVCSLRWTASTRCGQGGAGVQDWDLSLSGGGGPAVALQSGDTDAPSTRSGPNVLAFDECVVGRFLRFSIFQGYGLAGVGELELFGTPVASEPVCSTDGEYVSHDLGDPTDALWLVDTASSSINRWDTSGPDPVRLAQYRTGNPDNVCEGRCCWENGCNMPSRIIIDEIGDIYVANRGFSIVGSVTKIAGDLERCEDRNGNGAIETSFDGIPLDYGEDECILWTTNVGDSNDVLRALTVDQGDDEAPGGYVWVGGFNRRRLFKLHPEDGRELARFTSAISPYALVTDARGKLWISGLNDGRLQWLDTVTHELGPLTAFPDAVRNRCRDSYASTIDIHGRIWQTGYGCRDAVAYDPARETWCSVAVPGASQVGRGITTDLDGRVFAATNIANNSYVSHWHVDDCVANQRFELPPEQRIPAGPGVLGPTAVAFDGQGDVWLANFDSPHLVRFDTAENYAPTVYDAPGRVYSYSDVSGGVRQVVRSGLRGVENADYCLENTCGEAASVAFLGPEGGVVNLDTRDASSQGAGSCGGGSGQAVVAVAVEQWSRLEARLHDEDYSAMVHIRAHCPDARTELACRSGDGARAVLERVPPGTYFVIVDGEDGDTGQASVRVTLDAL